MSDILRENGIDYNPHGREQQKLECPKCHDSRKHKTDKSLSVNIKSKVWNCHNCGWQGPEYKSRTRSYDKPEPARIAALQPVVEEVYRYFASRAISKETVDDFAIANVTSPTGEKAIAFPYHKNDAIVNIKYRVYEGKKMFYQLRNAERVLYGYDKAKSRSCILIAEGEIDALSYAEAERRTGKKFDIGYCSVPDGGIQPNSSTVNAAKLDFVENSFDLLAKAERIYLSADNDEVGRFTNETLASRLGKLRCLIVSFPEGCKDANDVLRNLGPEALQKCLEEAKPYPIEGIHLAANFKESLLSIYRNGYPNGVESGDEQLDGLIKLFPGFPIVVTGAPGSGKSSFLDYWITRLSVHHGKRFAVFSPENWPMETHLQRYVEILIGKTLYSPSPSDVMTEAQIDSALKFLNDHIYLIRPDDESYSLDDILSKFEQAIQRYGVNGCIIDPWNTVEHQANGKPIHEYIGHALSRITNFAQQYGQYFFIVAHPRKLAENPDGTFQVPTMYSISGSADWFNKAGYGIVVYRDNTKEIPETVVFTQKIKNQKFMGKTGQASYVYDIDCQRFYPMGGYPDKENWLRVAARNQYHALRQLQVIPIDDDE